MQILLIEDDLAIAEALRDGLTRNGFEVSHTSSGLVGIQQAATADVVLLDLGLADLDGVEVCRRIRSARAVPIIVVSARDTELDRVMLLELGADDYLVKPFGLRELIARIRAVLRRIGADPTNDTTVFGPLQIDRRTRLVTVDGAAVALSPREFDLLDYLAIDAGAVRSRRDITAAVWGSPYLSPKTLDVLVAAVRKKLGSPEWIVAVRGIGFRLTAPTSEYPSDG